MFQMLRRASVLLILLLAMAVPALTVMAQESTVLIPFTDAGFGIQGVIPEGWSKVSPGIYARGSSASDTTLLGLQSTTTTLDNIMQALLPQFGLETAPDSVGTSETVDLSWTLYQFEATDNGTSVAVDLALAELDGTTYLALLEALPDEYERLHAEVFVPVLESISVLETEPVPYRVEAVTFTNGDVTLAGTLTIPDRAGRHPAVVLMSGSGPNERNEEVIPGYRIFEQIADYLTRQGIAVLRYDDRGVGQSTGDFAATSIYDFASDGKAAVAYLKTRDDINPDQVGVLGHSEGGLYDAILGADPDSGAAFIISLAGTAVSGEQVSLHQNELALRASGVSEAIIDLQLAFMNELFPLIAARDWDAVERLLVETILEQWSLLTEAEQAALGGDAEAYARQSAANFRQAYDVEWYSTMLEYDPVVGWAKTTVPVLAIFGGLDVQVDDAQNATPLVEALVQAGNQDFSVVVLPKGNHLFQEAVTGATSEYLVLPPQLMPNLMPTIVGWLLQHVDIVQ